MTKHRIPLAFVPFAFLFLFAPPLFAQVPVVLFHAHPNFGFTQDLFRQQMDFLLNNGYHTIGPDQFYEWLVHNEPLPIRPILLTVDDNYVRVYTDCFPILRERGQVIVNFAHSNYVGVPGANDHADWDEIREMESAEVVNTQSHTRTHANLANADATALVSEIAGSKADIEANIPGKSCLHIAYPGGAYDAEAIQACVDAGYRLGYTTISALNYHSTPLFEIRRIGIDGASVSTLASQIGFNSLPPAPPGDGWTIDNTDPNFYAAASDVAVATAVSGYYGSNYCVLQTGAGPVSVQWAAFLPKSGRCRVYARWPASSSFSSSVSITIRHEDGTTATTINQRELGGRWNSLGVYRFSASAPARVELTAGAGESAVADGVWFEPLAPEYSAFILY